MQRFLEAAYLKGAVALLFVALVFAPDLAAAQMQDDTSRVDAVRILYHVRPPYAELQGGRVSGLTADPAREAFTKSGIMHYWQEYPSNRQLGYVRQNQDPVCALGWFKTPEREQVARYTLPIYRDRKPVLMGRLGDERLENAKTIDEVLSDQEMYLLVKDGYSYGTFLDNKIREHRPNVGATAARDAVMARVISMGRADYMILAPEEGEVLLHTTDLGDKLTLYSHLQGMPEGQDRYLMCSRVVPDTVISALNEEIGRFYQAQAAN